MSQVSRNLPVGSCTDSLGWTHETWKLVLQQPHGRKLIRELLTLYACGELGHEGEDLLNSSLVIPLYKNASAEAIRPIAVPTAFRKCYARACIAMHRAALSEAAGPHQYAAMTRDGARLVATHLRNHSRQAGPRVYIRTDIRNAFNEIDRQHVLDTLQRTHPVLGAAQFSWLHRPSHAVIHCQEGTRRMLSTHLGIPQGDPLSSLTFAAALAPALQHMHEHDNKPFAYADDTVLTATPDGAMEAIRAWQEQLRRIGLSLNADKLQVWNPARAVLPPELERAFPSLQISTEGFVMCGLPVDTENGPARDQATPWGTPAFQQEFLTRVRNTFAARLRVLATFINNMGPHTDATHVALGILRCQLLTRHTHLARFCQRATLAAWAAVIDADVTEWLAHVLELPLNAPAACSALQVPVSRGGLGFLSHQHEAALHYLSATLPFAGEWSDDGEAETLRDDMNHAFEHLAHQARADLRPLIAHLEPHRQARKLRELFYDKLSLVMFDVCPWLQPPGLPDTKDGDITYRWMLRCQMSWYTGTPHLLLPRGPLRHAMACHLGLPVFMPGQRCHYTPVTTGRRCNQQLGQHSDHVHTCAHGPSMRRHNKLRDAWADLCREAGWHTQIEQLVFVSPETCKRADLVTLSPDGRKFACDVMVTASPAPAEPHAPHLHRMVTAKARQYLTVPWGKCHEDATFVPLIHDALNHWLPPDTLQFLHRAIMAVARRSAPEAPKAWGAHLTHTTLQHAAPLLHAACLASWQMHAACGCLL